MPAKVRRKINIDGYKSIKCNRLKPTKGKNKLKSMPLHIINKQINHLSSMNQYETVFILTPVLSDEQMKETVAKFKGLLTDNGAEILNEETWGLKKMAYAIQKKSTGFYCLLEFKAEPEVIKTLETGYRRDEKVIRFMTVKLDKYAVQYAEKRRNKLAKKEEA